MTCVATLLVPVTLPLARAQDADGDLLGDQVDPDPADPFNGGWRLLPGANGTFPLHRHEGDGCRVGEQFVVIGGRETSTAEIYTPTTNTWSKSSNAPIALHHGQTVFLNGLVYVIGAFVGGYPDETPVPDIYIFNPASKVWSKGPAIPSDRRRGAAASAAYGGKIYIAGGNTKGHRAGWVAWFDEFDPATGAWRRLPDAPRARDHHRAVVVGNRLYLISGRRTSYGQSGGVLENTIPEVDVYNLSTGVWSQLPKPIPTPRAGCAVIAHGREVVVAAGENADGASATVEALDIVTGTWRTFPSLTQERNGPVGFSDGAKLYISGGQSPANASQETLLLPARPLPPEKLVFPGSPSGVALTRVAAVNCGGGPVGSFEGDSSYDGGTAVVARTAIQGAEWAPEGVFQSQRQGQCRYTIEGLEPTATYRLELHFAELEENGVGQRIFDVWVNGEVALSQFDILAATGGRFRGVSRTFTVGPTPSGMIQVELRKGSGEPLLSGLGLFRASTYRSGSSGFALSRPFDVLATEGDPVGFAAMVSGKAPSGYQWRRNGVGLKGATQPVFRILRVNLSHAGEYSVMGNGTTASPSARLVVAGRPVFTPVVANGARTTLRVPYAGAGVTFQWFKDGTALEDTPTRSGTRSAVLAIAAFQESDAGSYQCELRAFGEVEMMGPCDVRLMRIPGLVNSPPTLGSVIGSYRWELQSSEVQTTFSITGLPKGLLYDPAKRLVSGTPLRPGEYNVTVTPNNPAGVGESRSFTVAVEAIPAAFLGPWTGLMERSNGVNGLLGGTVRATVTSTGAVSGTLRSGSVYPFAGQLRGIAAGDATLRATISRGKSSPLILSLTFPRNGQPASGLVMAGAYSAPVIAKRGAAVPPGVPPEVSAIHCILGLSNEAQIGDPAVPQGKGWLRLVRSVGNGRIVVSGTGRLADSTAIAFATVECEEGDLPIHSVFEAGNGSLSGWGQILEVVPKRHEFLGQVQWRKLRPVSSKDYSYRTSGVNVLLTGQGETFIPPASGLNILGSADALGNARISFQDGGLTGAKQGASLNQTFRLTPSSLAIFPGPGVNPAGVTMTINPATGIFTGAFRLRDGAITRDVSYQGLFSGTTGEGFFNLRQLPAQSSSPVLSGSVKVGGAP